MNKQLGKLMILVVVLSLMAGSAYAASAPAMQWHQQYNGSGEESHPHYVIETSDGGFLMVGETGFIPNSAKIYVVKTNSSGGLLWQKEFGSSGYNLGNGCVETPDGNYVIAGTLNYDAVLIKVYASNGNTISGWPKTWNLGSEDSFEAVENTQDGGLIATGYRNGLAESTFVNWGQGNLIKTDANGNQIWNKDISAYMHSGYRMKRISDGYMVSGHPATEGQPDYNLMKFDFDGNVVWYKTPYAGIYWGFDIDASGNMILAGHVTDGPLSNNHDIMTVKVDSGGNVLWTEYAGQPRGYNGQYIHDEAWGARATPDGGWIVTAGSGDEYSYSECGHPLGCSDQWIVYCLKYSSSGTLEWEGLYGGPGDWAGEDVCMTSDGGALVANDCGAFGFLKLEPFSGAPDTTPPTPDPMTWSSVPNATGESSIAMTATTASDPSGVEYYFDETTGGPGGTDSGWQANTSYSDTGLNSGTQYCYRVQARDKSVNQNATAYSSTQCATTTAPDTTPPTPDPMTWATVPYATGSSAIDMTATTATDPSGVQYYFDEITGGPGSTDSGWQSSTNYTDSGLDASTQYTYTVTARDVSVNFNETAASTSESATTSAPPVFKLDFGKATGVGSSWTNVTLSESYTSPVVVAVANYDNTSDPAVVRIQNASGSSFDVRVDAAGGTAPSGLDVHYMVVEEGVYTVASDGVKMEAVKYTSTVTDENNSWVGQPQTYSNTYTSPVVLGQVMTYADAGFSTFWCQGSARANPPDTSNLITGKSVAEDTDTTRNNETVGYIVIESGSGSMAGTNYVAALGADSVAGVTNAPPYTYSISGLSDASVAIASLSAMDGGNGGWALLYGANPVSATSINLVIDEDVIGDTERNHTAEQVAYIVFEETAGPDTDPPTPNPATFASAPSADSDTAISMTATTGSDASGPVEYFFDETSGGPGGSDSGWQANTSYTDSGLTASTQYTYTVQMRDSLLNTGTASSPANATTDPPPDTTPPTPDPMTWSALPSAGSDSAVSMTATTATDPSGVEYYFMETSANPGGSDSGWQDPASYTDTGLTGSTQYCYEVQARDKSVNQNATAWSTNECATTLTTPDTTPPTPDPMTWSSVPVAGGTDNISMTATTATDASGVEYNFDETSGNPGGTDSGWQDSTSYTDTGLSASTQYCYEVQARDKSVNQNATAVSTNQCATTDALPDTTPPTPDPMTWSSVPAAASSSQIDMTATTASDPSGVQYSFDETSGNPGATDSGWQTGASYSDTGLDADTQYCYQVKARDMSVNQNETAFSTNECATTQAGGWTQIQYDDFEGGFGNWIDGGLDCKLYTGGTYAHQGSNALDLEDNTSTSVATTANLALAGYAEIKVDFWYICVSMDNSAEDFWLQISTNGGSSFDTVEEWNEGDEFVNGTFYPDSVTISGYTLNNTTQLRFRCDASGGADDVYIDEVLVSASGEPVPDTDPPTPNPATFASAPSADSSSAISMTATTGSDASTPVEYYFDETTGGPGATDSGWQTSASYTDSGLSASTQYTYTVQMRDSVPNTGTASSPASATTQAGGGSWIKVDDRDGSVTYAGSTWHQTSPSTAYMNTATYTENMGITATYSFTGTQVRFYVWQYDTSQGYDVYIDDQFQQTVTVGSGSEASVQAWESGTLADTAHTLRLTTASGEPHVDAFEHFGN